MFEGLYTSATGMMAQMNRQDAIANNLANVNTTGYRRQITSIASSPVQFQPFLTASLGNALRPTSPTTPASYTTTLSMIGTSDNSAGIMRQTGNHTDLALEGDASFTVQFAGGEAYTRDGSFTLNNQQQLVTQQGYPVLGLNGPITITGSDWTVRPNGDVVVGGKTIDRLKIVQMPSGQATPPSRLGENLWTATAVAPATNFTVQQGVLEGSNVNTVSEMVDMLTSTRNFEANQQCVQAQDSVMNHIANDIAHA